VQGDQSHVLIVCVFDLLFQRERAVAAFVASEVAGIGEILYGLDVLILTGFAVTLEVPPFSERNVVTGAFSLVLLQVVVLRDEVDLARLDSTFDPLHAWTVIDGKD
jgi:hypothetical protein